MKFSNEVFRLSSSIPSEKGTMVGAAVSKLLMKFTYHCETKRCLELVDIIEKLVNHPFDLLTTDGIVINSVNDQDNSD